MAMNARTNRIAVEIARRVVERARDARTRAAAARRYAALAGADDAEGE